MSRPNCMWPGNALFLQQQILLTLISLFQKMVEFVMPCLSCYCWKRRPLYEHTEESYNWFIAGLSGARNPSGRFCKRLPLRDLEQICTTIEEWHRVWPIFVCVRVQNIQEFQLGNMTQEISGKFQNLIFLQQPAGWSWLEWSSNVNGDVTMM